MLRLYGDIEEALAHSNRWQIPLLIFVHGRNSPSDGDHQGSVDPPDLYDATAGRKRIINAEFQIGGGSLMNDAAAQRRVLGLILSESRLNTVTILHFMEVDTPSYELFTTSVPDANHAVPRLHVFPSSFRELPRNVLHGVTLTPGHVCESIRLALQIPPLSKVTELRNDFMQEVEAVNSAQSHSKTEGFSSRVPHHTQSVTGRGTAATDRSALAIASGDTDVAASPKDLHFIALNGLEKREIIVTSSGMTLRIVWQKVQHALKRERETGYAEPRLRKGTRFVLCVEPPATNGNSNSKVVVGSMEEAATMDIHALPHNTVVTVLMDDDKSTSAKPSASPLQGNACRSSRESEARNKDEEQGSTKGEGWTEAESCDKGSCRIRPQPFSTKVYTTQDDCEAKRKREEQRQQHAQQSSTATTEKINEEKESLCPAPVVSNHISIRCIFPDGRNHTENSIDPSVATLSTHLRLQIGLLLGNDAFVFVSSCPTRRFTAEDETRPLSEIGLCTSSTLRVVPTGDSSSLTPAPRNSNTRDHGWFGNFALPWSRGRSRDDALTASATAAPFVGTTHGTNRAVQGSRFRTMSDIRAEEEEEEKMRASMESAMHDLANEQRKKANHYYGGGSTEYIGRDDKEELQEDEETNDQDNDHDHKRTGERKGNA